MPETYYELTITVENAQIELIADFISQIYDEGVEFAEKQLILRGESDLTFIKEALLQLNEGLQPPISMAFHLEEKKNRDWIASYQKAITPIEAGKFYIFPSWYPPKEHAINIMIDPALAFGSGHHATTFSCLEAISHNVTQEDSVIDVGCGSGILGLAATKLGATVDLCDTDPLSIKSCQENFQLNHETYHHLWEGSIDKATQTYNIVIANIIADVLRFIAKDLKNACKENGILILSGILDKKEDLVKMSFQDLTLEKRVLNNEWVTLIYKKHKGI